MKNLVLVGNPNVGKTTFYNRLTNSSEHTGNWNGKTVGISSQMFYYNGVGYRVTDLPGISTLEKSTIEEKVAIEYLSKTEDKSIVFIDGTNIVRGLFLYFEVKKLVKDVSVVITMKDLLDKGGVVIDIKKLEELLGCNVIYINLTENRAIYTILEQLDSEHNKQVEHLENKSIEYQDKLQKQYEYCNKIAKITTNKCYQRSKTAEKLDEILLGKKTGIPSILLMLFCFLWLSLVFSNYFQGVLFNVFKYTIGEINNFLQYIGCSKELINIVVNGGLATSFFVATVMIPPMFVFFPLFTIMEETGVIPRIAFNVDGVLSKFGLSGKNSISLMLGFGCNCVGVTSSRIFENEKSRRVAILINNFVPCNGRLPMLFLLVFTFLAKDIFASFIIIVFIIMCNILLALFVGLVMNKLYRNNNSDFVYELPVYKKPKIIRVLKGSLIEKAIPVLIKSVSFSFMAGIVVIVLQSIEISGISLLNSLIVFLEPLGNIMGLSGVILVAFLFGISANEIVLPIAFMLYTNMGLFSNNLTISSLSQYGFSVTTAICMIVLSLNHYPCFSSLMTIKKETNSTTFTVICAIVPLVIGITFCICINFILLTLQSLLF